MNAAITDGHCQTLGAAILVGLSLAAAPAAYAGGHDDEELEFEEAHIFFELNNTDGDLGIHGKVDGGPWRELRISGPDNRSLLRIRARSQLANHGMTELFFESAEPPFDELDPKEFFARFAEGPYEIEGRTLDGAELDSEAELTHVMPAPPEASVNGEAAALNCDEDEPGYDASEVSGPVTISWADVTMSHPDADGGGAAVQPPVPVTIVNYEVVVEVAVELGDGEEFDSVFSAILPPGETALSIPAQFLAQGEEFKYEVLAREASDNQTAIESCFVLAD